MNKQSTTAILFSLKAATSDNLKLDPEKKINPNYKIKMRLTKVNKANILNYPTSFHFETSECVYAMCVINTEQTIFII